MYALKKNVYIIYIYITAEIIERVKPQKLNLPVQEEALIKSLLRPSIPNLKIYVKID